MIANAQPTEPRDHNKSGSLEVHSIFYTIQGEGPFAGRPAVFVRLAGCNLQCPGCDTDYTSQRERMSVETILANINYKHSEKKGKSSLVVVTGGEPFRQNVYPLFDTLIAAGWEVQVETNGTMKIDEERLSGMVTVVCSPKTAKLHPSVAGVVDAFKYVVTAGNLDPLDGLPYQALGHQATPCIARPDKYFGGIIYVQPRDEQDPIANGRNTEETVLTAMAHDYTVQLQIHKILKVE